MARFTVRIELHYADDDDYEVLHAAMERRGLLRTIEDSKGKTHHLPTAEYNLDGERTRDDVLGLAKAAATETRKNFMVLVTESAGRTWYNLPNV